MGLKFWKKFKSSTNENFANVKSKKIEQELEKEQQTMNKTIKRWILKKAPIAPIAPKIDV